MKHTITVINTRGKEYTVEFITKRAKEIYRKQLKQQYPYFVEKEGAKAKEVRYRMKEKNLTLDKKLKFEGHPGKIYKGRRLNPSEGLPEVEVTVNGRPLRHRIRHSPTGFEWGYLGSGPADLALSILWDFMGHEPTRVDYMCFKEWRVARWGNEWHITGEEIQNWLDTFGEAESVRV